MRKRANFDFIQYKLADRPISNFVSDESLLYCIYPYVTEEEFVKRIYDVLNFCP